MARPAVPSSTRAPRPPAQDVAGDLYALVTYLHASAHRDLLNAIAAEQLTFNQLLLLDYLRRDSRPTLAQAARLMRVTTGGATRLVAGLARRGLVRREPDERDQRAKHIVITDRGQAVIARLHAARLDHIAAFADALQPDERKPLEAALAKVTKRGEIAAHRPLAA